MSPERHQLEMLGNQRLYSIATISECENYRYTLERIWADGGRLVLWVMLNPSTADAMKDDRTIGRCISFSKAWGYDGILVGNLYALRSRDPKALTQAADPVGPCNMGHLMGLASRASLIVCAWGQPGPLDGQNKIVRDRLRAVQPVYHLGVNADGNPKHPLYLHSKTELRRWRWQNRRTALSA